MVSITRIFVLLFVALLGARELHATLIVSYLQGQTRLFDNAGNPLPNPGVTGQEGLACIVGGVPALFVADNSAVIYVYNPATLAPMGNATINLTGVSGGAIALSPDGALLYVADWNGNRIFAFSTSAVLTAAAANGTITPLHTVATPASHDVIVAANGDVYAADFQAGPIGVLKFSPTLTSQTSFVTAAVAAANGLDMASGMLIANGSFWVSNFRNNACTNLPSDPCSSVLQFDLSGNFVRKIAAIGMRPIGLAAGPGDGKVYVAMLGSNSIGVIDPGTSTFSTFMANAGSQPKYLQFTENCTSATDAFLEICKWSSLTNPVEGSFTFTASNGSFTSGPITVPVGLCSGPIGVPSGTVTITEGATPGVGVSSISAYGFNAQSLAESRLVSSDLANRTATVTVPAGPITAETIVNVTNFRVPTGVLEVCKDAAPGTTVTGNFSFTVSGAANNPYTVPAGACSGPIVVQAGSVMVTESTRTGFRLVDVATIPIDRIVSVNTAAGSAVVTVPAGDLGSATVVRFRNAPVNPEVGHLKICKVAGPGVAPGQTFTIVANGLSHTVPAGPASQGGYCVVAGEFPAGTNVTVQETPPFPYRVLSMTVSPPGRASAAASISETTGVVRLTIGSGFNEVTVTNIGSEPAGQLKICKVAGDGVPVGTNFTFSVAGSTIPPSAIRTYTVPAGPASQGGYCIIDSAFPRGTNVTVSEVASAGFRVTGIRVNGAAVPNSAPSATVSIGNGITQVAFTNAAGSPTNVTPMLAIVNYELVDRVSAGGTKAYVTYRADLLNTGGKLDSLRASLSGAEATLLFGAVPSNSQVRSSNTFTLLVDEALPFDFSKLEWTFEGKGRNVRRGVR